MIASEADASGQLNLAWTEVARKSAEESTFPSGVLGRVCAGPDGEVQVMYTQKAAA